MKTVLYEHFLIPVVIGTFILFPLFVHFIFGETNQGKAIAAETPIATTTTDITITPSVDLMEELIEQAESYTEQGIIRTVTSYTSTPEQTDSTPCIGADGNVCELWEKEYNICASNAFAFGTILRIDELGDCIVKDRMNGRFPNRVDWYSGYDEECLDGIHEGDNCPNWVKALAIKRNLIVTPIGYIEI